MKFSPISNYFILVFSLMSLSIYGQSLADKLDGYIESYVITGDFSGCVLIEEKGGILYNQCFGLADHTFGIPNTPETKFKIGSVAKQFTAAAILLLEEAGRLSLADTLANLLPGLPNAEKVTVLHLLTHTSGIPDIFTIPGFQDFHCGAKNIGDLSLILLESGFDFPPGTRYQYSNGGYAVLAHLIEEISGDKYEDFLEEHIFSPLGMSTTGHATVSQVVPKMASGYDPAGYSGVKHAAFINPELLKGSGSLHSTSGDLHIWVRSILNKSLLSENSYRKLMKNYGHNYGLGISVYKSFDYNIFGHDGRINGYITDYLHYVEPEVTITVIGNTQTGVADFFRRDIAAILLGRDYKSRAKTLPEMPYTRQEITTYVGTYSFGPQFNVYVDFLEGRLQARANEGGYTEVLRLDDGKFFSRTLYAGIEFIIEDDLVTGMVWTNNDGNSFSGTKK